MEIDFFLFEKEYNFMAIVIFSLPILCGRLSFTRERKEEFNFSLSSYSKPLFS